MAEAHISPDAAPRLAVDVRRLPFVRALAADYATDFGRLADFFAGNPAEGDAWRAAIERVQRADRPRGDIARAIADQQRRYGAPEAAVAAAGLLADPRTVAIVTGQQAGLFGGALYSLLKAVTAVKLAAHVSETYGVPAVAVFWIEAEDHDWAEVAGCTVLDRNFEPRAFTLPALPGSGRVPVAAINLDGAARPALQALAETLPPTEFTGALVERLEQAYQDATLPSAFGRLMAQLLGSRGLILYDASDTATKPFVRHLFRREIEEPGRTAREAREAGEALAARGYHAQVVQADDGPALFRLGEARTPLRLVQDGVKADGTRTATDLLREIETDPARFSPNVLLRPLVQDSLFPTAAYVAGPNELAYLAQLRRVYERFGVPMPLMYPRASATLVDSAAIRFLAKSGMPFEALARNDEAELNRLLEQQLPAPVERALTQAREALEERMGTLIEVLPQLDPTLEGAARSALGRMRHDLEVLHGKIIHAAKRRDETLRRQFAHARALAFPGGEPQERTVGFVYFLNRYGPWLVDRLVDELPIEMGAHWVLSL